MPNGHRITRTLVFGVAALYIVFGIARGVHSSWRERETRFDDVIRQNAAEALERGRRTFRDDTFGDEDFWGGALRLHEAIAGAANGGQGGGLSPSVALELGLKVDLERLPNSVVQQLRRGTVDLDDPAVTLALLKSDAVLGVKGFFRGDRLQSVGIQCALCHSTVDNALAPGIGRRLDGWANRDLNIGAIVALSPSLQPFVDLLGVPDSIVRLVLNSWGPGKFDAALALDGKAFRPDGKSAATLIPPAFGLAGVNLHTSTGWGSVTHWNGLVANLEMHGKGTFYDPRLNDAARFPIAARAGFGNVRSDPDLISPKLADLHAYQLAIPAPRPPEGSFDPGLARRGERVFNGTAKCATCHVPPLFTEPGWNMHTPAEIGIDDFQAERSPDRRYRTAPLKGLWTHTKGGFYHDGRFATLLDVVNHYDGFFTLGLSERDKRALVEYLKSLSDDVPSPVRHHVRLNAEPAAQDAQTSEAAEDRSIDLWPTPFSAGGALHLRLGSAWRGGGGLPADLEVSLFDVTGRRVAALGSGLEADATAGSVTWKGRDAQGNTLQPGVYFLRARARSTGLDVERRVVMR